MQSQLTFHFIRKTMNSNQHSSQSEPLQIEVGPFHSFALSPSPHFRNQGPWKDLVQSLQPPSSTLPGPCTGLLCWCPTGSLYSNVTFSVTTVILHGTPSCSFPALFIHKAFHFPTLYQTYICMLHECNYPPNWFLFTDSNPESSTKEFKYLLNWWMNCSTDMQSLLKWKARSPDNLRS